MHVWRTWSDGAAYESNVAILIDLRRALVSFGGQCFNVHDNET